MFLEQERNGDNTAGRAWILPVDKFKQDPWNERISGECSGTFKDGTRYEESHPLILSCNKIKAAYVSYEVCGSAVPGELLCEIDPLIASIKFPSQIFDKISEWVNKPLEDKQSLCREIRDYCEKCGFDRTIIAAAGLLVYLERNGGKRVK